MKKFLSGMVSACCILAAVNCYAAGPEPAPGSEGEIHAEEGMLSPSSESAGESVFGSTNSEEELGTDEKLQNLFPQIEASLPSGNGNWAVYVSDLVNDTEDYLNNSRMQAASLIKLYIMGAVYENYDAVIKNYDQGTVDSHLYSMITVSDNDSANALTTYLGGGDAAAGMAAVNTFCENHGFDATHMGRLLLQSNEYDDNYTSVVDCGRFLRAIYLEDVEFARTDKMFKLLKAQTRCNKIPAQMPEGVNIANKTGELADVENDAGIIYDSANDVVLVFMSENLSSPGEAQSTIASISRKIYSYYNS